MWHRLFRDPRTIDRYRGSWLGEVIAEYLEGLGSQKYAKNTLRRCASTLRRFASFTEVRGVTDLAALPGVVETYIKQPSDKPRDSRTIRLILQRFIRYLRGKGQLPPPALQKSSGHWSKVLEDYSRVLRDERGLTPKWISRIRDCNATFLRYVEASGIRDLVHLRVDTIHGFIGHEGTRYSRQSMRHQCSALRGFLGHLYRTGRTPRDLSACVMAPRLYRQESCPRFLSSHQVQAVLGAVDRRTRQGVRDYAILLLLATYALRGIEVLRLRLDDIDWQRDLLHIPGRKAGNSTIYPLSAAVGEAILRYLERGRPECSSRRLFLRVVVPYQPFSSNGGFRHIVVKYLCRAGIQLERAGTHTFRYSCAQTLLDRGVPLKTIGDYLGHRDPRSTCRYTLIALKDLREVALGDGEDVV